MEKYKILGQLVSIIIYGGVLMFLYRIGGMDMAIIGGLAIFLALFSDFLSDFKDYTREERKRQLEIETMDAELKAYKKHFGVEDDK